MGFFHSDPHPGNLLVDRAGRLVLIDFGLCAEIAAFDSRQLTSAIVHLMRADVPRLVEDGVALRFLPDDVDRTTYELKLGFIPGTKPDVDTGFMTVDEAKLACEKKAACLAFTFRAAAETKEKVHVYLKADSTVAESDKSWASYVKRPAGLMDVSFRNELPFPLELC